MTDDRNMNRMSEKEARRIIEKVKKETEKNKISTQIQRNSTITGHGINNPPWHGTPSSHSTTSADTAIHQHNFQFIHCHPKLRSVNRYVTAVSINSESSSFFSPTCELELEIKLFDKSFPMSYAKDIQDENITRTDIIMVTAFGRGMEGSPHRKTILIGGYEFNSMNTKFDYGSMDTATIKIKLTSDGFDVIDV